MNMTQEEYVNERGYYCPACKGVQFEGHEIEIGSGTANQEVTCLDCDATWIDHYTLSGYTLEVDNAQQN